jgi:hypothetical protein
MNDHIVLIDCSLLVPIKEGRMHLPCSINENISTRYWHTGGPVATWIKVTTLRNLDVLTFTYKMCYACEARPEGRYNLVFGGIRQSDVSRAQRDYYKNTENSGGDTFSGEISRSNPLAISIP